MRTLGNILWFILGGFISAIVFFVIGLVLCITIIGIPFGRQCFKLSKLSLSPFGKTIKTRFGSHPIANLLWFICGGEVEALVYILVGILFHITIIGIPFGKQYFKFANLVAFPFGATIE